MKKLLATIATSVIVATAANASITVNWIAGNGIESPFIPGNNMPAGLYAQLIWSPTIGLFSTFNNADPLALDNGNIQLGTYTDPNGGGFATGTLTYHDGSGVLAAISEATLLGGGVYIRVFSDNAPGVGDYWGQMSVMESPLNDQDPSPGTSNTADLAPTEDVRFNGWVQIVPEPSVLAFLGIGAALVGIRRMRRS